MFARRKSHWRGRRALGISFLILSTIHIPLPQPDYHNIRHHDTPGEICPYHDHLLRWHPSADANEDVALLHWHWFVPLVEPGARQPGSDDEHRAPGSGPALHAHLGDWPEPDWTGSPVLRPDGRGRLLDRLALELSAGADSPFNSVALASGSLQSGWSSACPPGGVALLRAARTSLFQRWNC
ncbi:MAG: hypothetical protein ACLQGP_34025 [Isosphaeraceae bacterium]